MGGNYFNFAQPPSAGLGDPRPFVGWLARPEARDLRARSLDLARNWSERIRARRGLRAGWTGFVGRVSIRQRGAGVSLAAVRAPSVHGYARRLCRVTKRNDVAMPSCWLLARAGCGMGRCALSPSLGERTGRSGRAGPLHNLRDNQRAGSGSATTCSSKFASLVEEFGDTA